VEEVLASAQESVQDHVAALVPFADADWETIAVTTDLQIA
jgi:hypothetical protein